MGIVASYTDQTKRRRRTAKSTARALLAGMGLSVETDAAAQAALREVEVAAQGRVLPDWRVVEADVAPGWTPPAPWRLTLETGEEREGRGPVPATPLGLHRLEVSGTACTMISAPAKLPAPQRTWGAMLPLHAMRSGQDGGLSDYADLAQAGTALAETGADFLGLNPLHAGFWDPAVAFSPYTPSHRRRLSALHVGLPRGTAPLGDLIDFAAVRRDRYHALSATFASFDAQEDPSAFDRWRRAEGASLERFALHQALSDRHGPYWTDWPTALREPDGDAARQMAHTLERDVRFHAWLQWRAETELADAQARSLAGGMRLGLYLDLAVGTHPAGAETWEDRHSFATGVSLGAPPDAFASDGQSWGLAPFNPHALVAQGFRPLADTLRRQLRLCGLLRIDHILGFDRAFWVPDGGGAGAYVQMPRDAMLAVVRLEAARAGAMVVGEDLGNVPRGLRGALDCAGILGCKLQIFEISARGARSPKTYPAASIASFSTHDLPTWGGWRAGHDIETHRALGHIGADATERAMQDRQSDVAHLDAVTQQAAPRDLPAASVDRMHHALAATGSGLAMVQIENVLDITPQPNLPGTVDTYPNWRQTLPIGARDLAAHAALNRTAKIMAQHGRGRYTSDSFTGADDDTDTRPDHAV